MAWGAAATGTPARHRFDRPGPVADAGVAVRDHPGPACPSWCSTWPAAQGDYFQATRGGGPRRLPPHRVGADGRRRGHELVQRGIRPGRHLAQPGARRSATTTSPTPASRCRSSRSTCRLRRRPTGPSTGPRVGPGRAKLVSPLGAAKQRDDVGYDLSVHYRPCADAHRGDGRRRRAPGRGRSTCDDADVIVVAFGTLARFVRPRSPSCAPRATGSGYVRPITLWPFPEAAIAEAADGCRAVAVYENNEGQMIDDVRLAVLGRVPGRRSSAASASTRPASAIGPDLDVAELSARTSVVLDRCAGGVTRMKRIDGLADRRHRRAARRRLARRRLHPGPHRRGRAPPLPRLRRARRHALDARDASTELGLADRTIAVFGIGCYTAFSNNLDVEVLQALHGRAPSVATGRQAHAARDPRLHPPGRRRHGERGPPGGAPHGRPRRERHLLPAQQRRVRRDRAAT